jgi:hypothetical protein
MIMHYIVQAIFLFTGIIALWASVFNNDWLFTADNARWVVKRFGRKGARWAYGAVGAIFIFAAIYFYYQISRL